MHLVKFTRYLFVLHLGVFLFFGKAFVTDINGNIDSHLAEFSYVNVTHHDNIDDEKHSHSHKHSEDGEEHEHRHEHSKVSQTEINFEKQADEVEGLWPIHESKLGIIEKKLISSSHTLEIFRPPIKFKNFL